MSDLSDKPGAVVVVGSLHYDIMVDAPERPRRGETVAGHRWRPKFGGKGGNQATAARMAGAPTRMAGAVGDDDFGAFLLKGLDAAGVDRTHVAVLPGAASGMSVAICDKDGDYGAVIVSGSNLRIPDGFLGAADFWRNARILLLQNETTEEVNAAAARRARAAGVLVCLNAAPARPLGSDMAELVDVLVVNAVEAEMLSGISVGGVEDARRAAVALRRDGRAAVVTAGGAGVAAATAERSFSVPAVPVEVAGTHGAGDAFVGVFAAATAGGKTFEEAITQANMAASAHVAGRLHPIAARSADHGPES
jgi:ribokinase